MRLALLTAALLLGAPCESLAAGPAQNTDQSLASQASANVAALDAAYSYAAGTHINTDGDTVVVRRIRQFVVVSFLAPCSVQHHCYGGRFHVVYDLGKRKIVHSLGED